MTVPELVEDAESIGGLAPAGEPEQDGQSKVYTFTFPTQQHRLEPGDKVVDPFTGKNPGNPGPAKHAFLTQSVGEADSFPKRECRP